MTYFDPKEYDWKKLKGEEAEFMKGYNYAIEEFETAFDNIIIFPRGYDAATPTLNKLIREIQEQLRDETLEWMKMYRVELTCSIMESNLEKYGEDEESN